MKYKCCFCGKEFNDWGNDPWPVEKDPKAFCCDRCNIEIVIPARLQKMTEGD